MDLLIIIGKTILFYILLIFILRIMGKREVGELSIFDVVVFFLISELFSLAIDDDTKLISVIVPIGIIVFLQLITSKVALINEKFRKLIDGEPVIIIENGIINQKELKRHRYSIDDLYLQLRENGVDSFNNIKFAILETNGKLSIILKENSNLKSPFPLIKDGILNKKLLKTINIDESWIIKEMSILNIKSYNEIFLLLYEKSGLVFVLKEKVDKK